MAVPSRVLRGIPTWRPERISVGSYSPFGIGPGGLVLFAPRMDHPYALVTTTRRIRAGVFRRLGPLRPPSVGSRAALTIGRHHPNLSIAQSPGGERTSTMSCHRHPAGSECDWVRNRLPLRSGTRQIERRARSAPLSCAPIRSLLGNPLGPSNAGSRKLAGRSSRTLASLR